MQQLDEYMEPNINLNEVKRDLAKQIQGGSESMVEIAHAPAGTSRFQQAIYLHDFTPRAIDILRDQERNTCFTAGLASKEILKRLRGSRPGEETKRIGKDSFMLEKPIVSFDLDFKDVVSKYQPSAREHLTKHILEDVKMAVLSEQLSVWLIVMSGNGLHLHFKFRQPWSLDAFPGFNGVEIYKNAYTSARVYLEKVIGKPFDRACSNPARLMRLPLTFNRKDPNDPVECRVLFHRQDADFTDSWEGFTELAKAGLVKDDPKITFDPYKRSVRENLDLLKVLKHFKYLKEGTIVETETGAVCSSPFSLDTTPSFFYDSTKGVFYDFSTGLGGDLFTLVAHLKGLDVKKHFARVLAISARIAGVETPANFRRREAALAVKKSSEVSESPAPGESAPVDSQAVQAATTNDGQDVVPTPAAHVSYDADSGFAEHAGEGYYVEEDGLWYQGRDSEGERLWLSTPITVKAMTSDSQGKGWGRELLISDDRGVERSWIMPMELLAGSGTEIRRNLLHLGARLSFNQREKLLLLAYLQDTSTEQYVECVSTIGWHKGKYVLPNKVISDNKSEVSLAIHNWSGKDPFTVSGSLEEWQEHVVKLCEGNSRLLFAISVAFAAVLLQQTGAESGGFHFVGSSSIGKSITLKVAASVWGDTSLQGFVKPWRSTINGLELLAVSRCDSLLVLDELGAIEPKEAGNAAYMLSSGMSKTRANKSIGLDESQVWRTLVLSSGEVTLNSHMQQAGIKTNVGQEVRIIDLRADADSGLGVFEETHGLDAADFAIKLSRNCDVYFGSPITEFIRNLINDDVVGSKLSAIGKDFAASLPSRGSQLDRVKQRFALAAMAGELAVSYGVLPLESGVVISAVQQLFKEWSLTWADKGDSREVDQLLAHIRLLIQENAVACFPDLGSLNEKKISVRGLWGFRRKVEGGYDWLILSQIFKEHFCLTYGYKQAVKDLSGLGFLSGPEQGRLPLIGKVRYVTISGKLIED